MRSSGDSGSQGPAKSVQSSQEGLMRTAESQPQALEVINKTGSHTHSGDSRGGLDINEALENELSLRLAGSNVWTDNNVSSGLSGSEFASAVPAE